MTDGNKVIIVRSLTATNINKSGESIFLLSGENYPTFSGGVPGEPGGLGRQELQLIIQSVLLLLIILFDIIGFSKENKPAKISPNVLNLNIFIHCKQTNKSLHFGLGSRAAASKYQKRETLEIRTILEKKSN